MMKSILNLIFFKNAQPAYQSSSFQHEASSVPAIKVEPQFAMQNNVTLKEDYQVAEISIDEFKSATLRVERRKFPRKPGETRSSYSTKQ